MNEALLLAGGFGARLGELTKETPKPVLPVAGVPFLEHLIWNLRRHGLERLLISTGYLAEKVEAALGDGSRYGVRLSYNVETVPLGTGGATKFSRDKLDDEFFVLNADTLYDCNLWALKAAKTDDVVAAMALRHVPDVSRYGGSVLEGDRVVAFSEKGRTGPGLINAGIYWLNQKALDRLPEGKCSLERDLFANLAQEGLLAGVSSSGFFIDIGLPETLEEANVSVPRWKKKRCAFLDRDGVLNVNTHHTHRPEEFQWVPGSAEAVRWLNENGYLAIIVTNQAGIAKGKYTEKQFFEFMDWMHAQYQAKGAHWDGVYYCPYHPTEGIGDYLRDSEDRKPKPGMILRALREWDIELEGSFLLGDKQSDVDAAESAGIPGFLLKEGQETVLEAVHRATRSLER